MEVQEQKGGLPPFFVLVLRIAIVMLLLIGFLVAIQMMSGAFKLLGKGASEGLFQGVVNPFASLAVGVLATVLVQSSSTTTSTIVALVGSGQLSVAAAVPMVMGANIGTTITNTLVSIGHVRRSQEFQRAFAAATVHDFFNLICVAVFLPLELMTGFLAKAATHLADWLSSSMGGAGGKFDSPIKSTIKTIYKTVLGVLEDLGFTGTGLGVAVLVLGIALTFFCLIFITRNMRQLIAGPLEHAMNRSLGRSGLIGITVGIAVTFAVQSSSITTSLLVPMCAAGILSLENAFPIMLGANIGTTLTALLASLATDSSAGLAIALVHALFNLCGVALFYPFQRVRAIPLMMARYLARKTADNTLYLVAYVGGVFVLLPLAGWWIFNQVSR